MSTPFSKLKNFANGEDEEAGLLSEVRHDCDVCTTLSWETRIKGFAACFVIGLLLTVVAVVFVFTKNYTAFGVVYSLGSLTSIASSMFLSGPMNQMKKMLEEKRFIATLVMLLMVALTMCAALWWKQGVLTLVFALCQFLAMAWYCLSYIPYARTAVKNCFSSCLS